MVQLKEFKTSIKKRFANKKNHPAEQDGFFIDQNLTGVINGERL